MIFTLQYWIPLSSKVLLTTKSQVEQTLNIFLNPDYGVIFNTNYGVWDANLLQLIGRLGSGYNVREAYCL